MSKSWTWLVVPELYRIEWIYLGALTLLSCLLPRRSTMLNCINRALRRLANRRRAAVLVTVMVVLVGRLALMGSLGIPRPGIADEFGYLLIADTFAQGRMSNPTPPMWRSLETIHVFHTPTYQSQYPIGYSAVLALAQVVLKNPWWAVYLTTALMCGAITWMLQAWLPPYWALMGGLFVAIRFGLFSYWMNSFWGGSLAGLGGALIFGALPRVTKRLGRARYFHADPILCASILLALGLAMLASSRPFEGFVISLPVAAVFLQWLLSQRGNSLQYALRHALLPCIVILGLTAAMTLYYQHRVTGDALKSPYDVALKQLHVTRPFIFQTPFPTPHYDNLEMRIMYLHFAAQTAAQMSDPMSLLGSLEARATRYWQFFVGPLMTLPFFGCLLSLRDRKLRVVWVTVFLLTVALLIESWVQVHYLAPGFCLFVLLLLEGVRCIKVLHVQRYAAGARIIRTLPIVCILLMGLRAFAFSESDGIATHWPENWAYSTQRLYNREQIEDTLRGMAGQHLVFVRYRYPFHNYHRELVYNGADLPTTKILWARSMDANQNCSFLQAYRGRRLWIVDEWGDVTKFSSATEAQVCDALNPIYGPNQPLEYYTKTSILRAKLNKNPGDSGGNSGRALH